MFITKLLKLPNLMVSANELLLINQKENNQYEVGLYGMTHLVGKNMAELLINIQIPDGILAVELRKQIQQHGTAGSHLLLAIGNYLAWGYVCLHVVDNKQQVLMNMQMSGLGGELPDITPRSEIPDQKFSLSRFATINREGDEIVLTRPMKDKRFIIKMGTADRLIFLLLSGTSLLEIESHFSTDKQEGVYLMLGLLLAEEFLVSYDKNAQMPSRLEEGSDVDTQWDVADLNLHSSSRLGYHFGEFGGGFPFVNLIEPRPSVRPIPAGKQIDLYRPNIEDLIAHDAPLTQVQMQRMSVRQYNEDKPISLKQIGEFLYRTARVTFESDVEVTNIKDETQKTNMGLAWRPYPTGGASYELEIYLTVDRATDLEAGFYYYAPKTHQLVQLSQKDYRTETLIDSAHTSCARIVRPQVVVHIAARFQRVSWKYHAIAYATTLRNTGVLYQTFYLNAIAMGISPCGLGSGHAKMFADLSGNDPLVESNVGEFMLGSLPEEFNLSTLGLADMARIHGAVLASNNQ